MIKTVDTEWLWRRAKALDKSNTKKYGCTTTASGICHDLEKCIIKFDDYYGTMEIDYDMYRRLYKEAEEDAKKRREQWEREHSKK